MERAAFFNLDLRQPVNQWLGIALVSLMCFWVVLYYFAQKSELVAQSFVSQASTHTTDRSSYY